MNSESITPEFLFWSYIVLSISCTIGICRFMNYIVRRDSWQNLSPDMFHKVDDRLPDLGKPVVAKLALSNGLFMLGIVKMSTGSNVRPHTWQVVYSPTKVILSHSWVVLSWAYLETELS